MKIISSSFLFYGFLFSLSFTDLPGQEMVLVVERCKALDQTSPIHNIWVDEDNVKWVANKKGLYKVLAIDLVQNASVPTGSTSLLMIRGGNANITWNTAEMQSLLNNALISSASYDPKTKSLWIGTQDEGAFQVSVSPLRIMQRFNMENKKLTSNKINDIFIQSNGTIWIATDDGMLTGSGDKWSHQERYLNFVGVDAWGQNLWILGDNFLWQVDNKGKWLPIAIELKNVEGQLRDIAVDDEGRVWIASNMMTGYNAELNKYQRFGPGQYFTSQYVNCLDVDQDGSIWTGTDDKGLYLIQWEAAMTVNILTDKPLDCKSADPTAALSVKVTGGEPPYTYAWNSGQTTDKISQLKAGHYQLSVTDSKGLVKTAKYEIPDPSIQIAFEIIKPSSGSPQGDASVNLLLNGGSGAFVIQWDNGEDKQLATKLTAGPHSVTVTDQSGCTATTALTVPEKVTPLSVTLSSIAENKCADGMDGAIQAQVTGGKAPIRYQWSNGSEAEGNLTGLAPGPYTVTITDGAGQTFTAAITLTSPASLVVTSDLITAALVSASNGHAQVKVSGGKSPYTYRWDTGETTSAAKALAAGIHKVTVTDANGCSNIAFVDVSENITKLGALVKQIGQINCYGHATASLRLDISGGKGPYTYIWNNGQTTPVAESLKAGNYVVTVTDAVGNVFTASSVISQPEPISITLAIDAPASTNGSDGKATAKVTGGTSPYQYAWNNGEKTNKVLSLPAGTHILTVTDAAGCTNTASIIITENILALQTTVTQISEVSCAGATDGSLQATVKGGKSPYTYTWSNGQSADKIINLGAGEYFVTVTDVAGNSSVTSMVIAQPQPVAVTITPDAAASVNGSDGKATAKATGGTGKYSYAWDSGETVAKAIAFKEGNHTLTVTDENGCTVTAWIVITENILPLSVSIIQSGKILCAGTSDGTLQAEAKGGKPPYIYKWSHGVKDWTGVTIAHLAAGQYSVEVTDAIGSVSSAQFSITEPKPLLVEQVELIPASTGNADGSVMIKATGGTPGYSIDGLAWAANTSSRQMTNLKPGDHLFVVKDAAGCTAEIAVKIKENILPLTVTIRQTKNILCAGNAEASLESSVKGGKPPYTYIWNNQEGSSSISSISDGTYTLEVTDFSGLRGEAEFKVNAPPKLSLELTNLRSATNDRINDGKGSVNVKGGASPYTYSWNSGETGIQAAKLPLGPGTVVVTDANGCTASADFIIKEKVLPELTATRLASGEPIRMEKIQFQADSVKVEPEAVPSLDELYNFLYDNPTVIIEVSGHTNSLPADDYCDRISTERAQSVSQYLIDKGIEQRRVIAKGYGKRKPVATNQTAEGRKRNQRVEIRLIKIEE